MGEGDNMAKGSGGSRGNFASSSAVARRRAASSINSVRVGQRVVSARNSVTGIVTGRIANFGGRGPAFRIRTADGTSAAIPFDEVLRR